MADTPKRIALALVAGLVLLTASSAASLWLYVVSHDFYQAVTRSLEFQSLADRLLVLAQDAETGQRGFLLTSDRNYLRPYERGASEAPATLDRLDRAAERDPAQRTRIGRLHVLVDGKLAELAHTIERVEASDLPGALAIVKNNSGNELMVQIRADIAAIDDHETMMRAGLRKEAERTSTVLATIGILSVIILLALASITIIGARRYARQLIDAQRAHHRLAAIATEAQAAAEQASRAKTDFLASMSHEIRTPLNAVLGYTDLLLDDETLGEGQRERMTRIQSAGSALLTVVNDILDFSKIEAGQVELVTKAFYLDVFVDNAISIVRGLAKSKQITLSAIIDAKTPNMLVGDEDRLRQIVLNLLNNAVKFTPAGTVELQIGCALRPEKLAALRVSVTDTGIGIPGDKRSRLFERFSQVDSSVGRDYGGTGLGLAICKNLVDLMGGRIGVDSRPGGGSVFWFDVALPYLEASPAPQPTKAIRAKASKLASILLAEDVELNQDIARAMIEAAGHYVQIVADGAEALAAVRSKTFDLVLMDIQMPGMDGITATRRIREMSDTVRDIPIIAMTANVLPAQIAEFRAAGMDDHVGKPFNRQDLYAAIDRWSSGRDARMSPG